MKRTRDADGFTERFEKLLEQYGSKNIEAAKKIVNESYGDVGGYQGRLNTAVAREHEQTGYTLDKLHKRLDDISDYGVPIDDNLIIRLFGHTPAFNTALGNSKAKRAAPEFTKRLEELLGNQGWSFDDVKTYLQENMQSVETQQVFDYETYLSALPQ